MYHTTAADLAARCHRAAIEGRWATTMRCSTALTIDGESYRMRAHRERADRLRLGLGAPPRA